VAVAGAGKVEVQLGSPTTQVGQGVYVQVVVSVEGQGELSDPEFPKLDGVQIEAQGTSFQSSMSFGTSQRATRTVNKTFEYLLIPEKPGKFEVAVEVGIDGKKIKATRVPVLEVTGEAASPPEATQAQAGARPTSAEQEVFLWPSVDKDTAYVGEPLVYRFEIWERTNADVQLRTMPSFDDFWVEELEAGRRRRDQVQSVPYRVHPLLERVLFPQKSGRLTIGGGEVVVTPHGGLGLLRPRRRRAPYYVPGTPLAVEVKPLPAKGQPADFSANNVGFFALQTTVDRTELKQGEAFTLTVTIEGTGNVRFVELAQWPELSGMRRYEPKEDFQLTVSGSQIGGRRSYEFLVVAEEAGTLEIPVHKLAYFDPEEEKYAVAESEPIRIRVEADPTAVVGKQADLENMEVADEGELLADVFDSGRLPRAVPTDSWLTPSRFVTAALTVPGLFGVGLLGRAVHRRMTGDEASRARAARAKHRRELMDKAKASVGSGDGFFTAIHELLHEVAVARAGAEGIGLPEERLLKLLAAREVAPPEIEALAKLLATCDAARFGAQVGDQAARRDLLHQALALVDSPTWRAGRG
jgi:hypothetical protein